MSSTDSHPIRALLVEDGVVNQKLLTHLLNGQGCVVTLATNGQQAVEKVVEDDFDVVLMDVQMPVMDGLTATRLIRQREAGTEKRMPIVGVTAGVDRNSCMEAGMDEYLAKPVAADSLRDKLEQVLGECR